MPKQWKNLTELRALAKDAGVTSVHKKDEATLLEALTAAGVEVEETKTDGKSAKVTEKKETPTNADKKDDTPKEPTKAAKTTGGKGSDVDKCRARIAKAKAELLAARSALKDALKADAKNGKSDKPKSHIELLNEARAADKASEALKKAREVATLKRLSKDNRAQAMAKMQAAKGKAKK